MPSRVIWRNGKFYPESEAHLSLYSSSVNFGDAVFEMQRTFSKKVFRLNEHLDRLFASAKYVGIDIPYTKSELFAFHEQLLAVNEKEFAQYDEIRTLIHVDRGILPIYENMGFELGPQIFITAFPLRWIVKGASEYYEKGVSAVIVPQRQACDIEAKVKHRSRLALRIADLQARETGSWAILLDRDGCLAEGTGSSIFLVKDGCLYTPKNTYSLRGISQQYTKGLAKSHNIRCEERSLDVYDGVTADEIFFTNTPFCIVPVTKFNHRPVGDGKVGSITKFLSEQWEKEVGCNWREQAKKWDSQA